jgi:NAD+ kinase
MLRKVGVYYYEQPATTEFAAALAARIADAGVDVWACPAWGDEGHEQVPGSDLIICVGGDGTVLRAARVVIPHAVPLLGVNMGRLGFLTELPPEDAERRLPDILAGAGRVEERAMLEAELHGTGDPGPHEALNDIVIGRQSIGRPIWVDVTIDGSPFTTYRADAVVLASATGSTGYNLSAGGPILHPESRDMVLTPVAPHLSLTRSIVLPGDSRVEMVVQGNPNAGLSVDGQDIRVGEGATIRIRRSPHIARFLRLSPPQRFFRVVGRHLQSADSVASGETAEGVDAS